MKLPSPSLLLTTGCLAFAGCTTHQPAPTAAAADGGTPSTTTRTAAPAPAPGADRPHNIVVVVVDDLGWADLACYGSPFHDTPALDTLAATGIRFTNAYAASTVCSPTRAALLTGRHPVRLNITDWIPGFNARDPQLITPEDRHELDLDEVTLAEALKDHGYATGYFGKWHLGMTASHWPEAHGFDVNVGGFSVGTPPGGYYSPYKNPRLSDGPDGEYLTDRLTDEAIAFIQQQRDNPFLAYIAYYNVHTPIEGSARWDDYYTAKLAATDLQDPDAFVQEGAMRGRVHQATPRYAAMVRAVDDNVGRLLAALAELNIDQRTVVVFTSDNGGLTMLPNRLGPTSNLPLRAGKGWLFEGGVRVPLIVRHPGQPAPGAVTAQVATSMDLMPTVLALAGLPLRPELHSDGVSLASAIANPQQATPRTLVWHFPHYHSSGWRPGSAIRAGDWKLILDYESGNSQLFDLASDIGEQVDRAASDPQQHAALRAALDQTLDELGANRPVRQGSKGESD
jgi:arylsulfatase A-like enzyme